MKIRIVLLCLAIAAVTIGATYSLLYHRRTDAVGEFACKLASYFISTDNMQLFNKLYQSSDFKDQPIWVVLGAYRCICTNRRTLTWATVNQEKSDFIFGSFEEIPGYKGSAWRRALWLEVYPRAKKALGPLEAVDEILAYVAANVYIVNCSQRPNCSYDIMATWVLGYGDRRSFGLLSVASLRSVGIPARLCEDNMIEWYHNGVWRLAKDYARIHEVLRRGGPTGQPKHAEGQRAK